MAPITDDQIDKLLKENIALNRDVLKMLTRMQRALLVGRIWGVAKVAALVIPLVWGYWALRPYVTQAINLYTGLLGQKTSVQGTRGSTQPSGQMNQLDELTELLKLVR